MIAFIKKWSKKGLDEAKKLEQKLPNKKTTQGSKENQEQKRETSKPHPVPNQQTLEEYEKNLPKQEK